MIRHTPRTVTPTITATEDGRSGTVSYRAAAGILTFFWEFGAGDCVASVQVGTEAEWRARYPWAAPEREAILRVVGEELVRQKAPSCRVDAEGPDGRLLILRNGPPQVPARPAQFPTKRLQDVRRLVALGALGVTCALGAAAWLFDRSLKIDPGPGTPLGRTVRTDAHVATLIQTLEAYTPSLHRDGSRDRYRVSLCLTPLDGSESTLVPLAIGLAPSALALAKVLGSDGRTLWYDVCGVGGIDLQTLRKVESPSGRPLVVPAGLNGAQTTPLPLPPAAYLCAGLFVAADAWLGLHSDAEVAGACQPGRSLRRGQRADEGKAVRRFHRAVVEPSTGGARLAIVSMTRLADTEHFDAAFLRLDDASEPLRLTDPDGVLMVSSRERGLGGTTLLSRVDTSGTVLWQVDTEIDRFTLQQVLPGEASTAFVGTRPRVEGRVPEPLLALVDHRTGTLSVRSLWR
ncbi:MAG: hypothetical protein R3F49_23885 [Planctomycetota bacterium]